MKKLLIIALFLIVATGALIADDLTTPAKNLVMNLSVSQSLTAKITDSIISNTSQYDDAVELTNKAVTYDTGNNPLDVQFYFNTLTNLTGTAKVQIAPKFFTRVGGGSGTISYDVYHTDKNTTSVRSTASGTTYADFYSIDITAPGNKLDSRKIIVDIDDEDFVAASSGDFSATISFKVIAN
jgi:hypothetical protein